MAKPKHNRHPARGGISSRSVRADFPLVQSANRPIIRGLPRNSASPLISTVLDDTKKQVRRPGLRLSPVLSSRATHRVERVPSPWEKVFSVVSLPKRAITCAKRSIRREVLHALKLTSKGAGARSRARTIDSKEICHGR